MSISDNYEPIKVVGGNNIITGDWRLFDPDYLVAMWENIATGVRTPKTLGVDFAITSYDDDGFITDWTLSGGTPATVYVLLSRNLPLVQAVPYKTSRGFQGKNQENSFDFLTAIDQDLRDYQKRTPALQVGSDVIDVIIAPPVAGKALVWNATADGIENSDDTLNDIIAAATALAAASAASAAAAAASAASAAGYAAGLASTSTTSVTVGAGLKSFTTQANKSYAPNMFISSVSAGTLAYMHGLVNSYNSTTGALVINVLDIGGSGTNTDWNISVSGSQGPSGSFDINGLAQDTNPDATADFVPTYDVSAGANKKVLLSNVFKSINTLPYQAAPSGANDAIAIYNAAGTAGQKIAIQDVFKTITALTSKATPVGADSIVINDSAASGAPKKVLLSALTGAAGGASTSSNASNLVLVAASNKYQLVTMTVAGLSTVLPDATTLSGAGMNLFEIKNGGMLPFTVVDNAGKVLAILRAGEAYLFAASDITTAAGIWAVGALSAGEILPALTNSNNAKNTILATSGTGITSMVYVPLTSSTFLAAYVDLAATSAVKAQVVTISGETLTAGTPVTVEAIANMRTVSAVALSATSVVLTYGTNGTTKAMVVSISGTTVTTNTAVVVNAVAANFIHSFFISSTSVFVAFNATGNVQKGVVLSISGTTITVNTVVQSGTALSADYGYSVVELVAGTTYLTASVAGSTGGNVNMQVITISGVTVTFNTNFGVSSGVNGCTNLMAVALNATTVAFMFNGTVNVYNQPSPVQAYYQDIISVAMVSISGTTISASSPAVIYFPSAFSAVTNAFNRIFGAIACTGNTVVFFGSFGGTAAQQGSIAVKFDPANMEATIGQIKYNAFGYQIGVGRQAILPGKYISGAYGCAQGGGTGGYSSNGMVYNFGSQVVNAVY